MSDKPLTKDKIAAAIQNAPAVADVLKKLAGKVARGVRLPASFTARGLDYAAQRELEHLLGTIGQRQPDGSFYIQLHEFLRGPEMWREAMEYFGLARERRADSSKDIFARLKLLVPEAEEAIDLLSQRDEVLRFVADSQNAKDWIRLFRHMVEKRLLRDDSSAITLSQLGSDCFNDSKKLRTGPLRRQLTHILSIFADHNPNDERTVFGHFGIIENPYTTSVTAFIPIAFITKACRQFDFPRQLFDEGLAFQLPLETMESILGVGWDRSVSMTVTTCENAAPFARMVERRIPCVYTEGYPNYCVKRLLTVLHMAGVKCVHEGDADLDGFNIAHEVSTCIDVKRVVASDALKIAMKAVPTAGIPLTDEQRVRAESFLECNPHCICANAIRQMLDWGRWIEQESFETILAKERR